MKSQYRNLASAALALALLPAIARATPPSTKLQPGLWMFHYTSTVQMFAGAVRTIHQTSRECIKNTNPAKIPLMAKLPPNIQCTAPALQIIAKGYHVTMACTASEPNGMVTHLDEDFVITPGSGGSQISFAGTVHQRITGAPVSIPATTVHISAQGHRIGLCLGSKG